MYALRAADAITTTTPLQCVSCYEYVFDRVSFWFDKVNCAAYITHHTRKKGVIFHFNVHEEATRTTEQTYWNNAIVSQLVSKTILLLLSANSNYFLELCHWSHRISVCAWGVISGFQYFDSFWIWLILNYVQTHESWFTTI